MGYLHPRAERDEARQVAIAHDGLEDVRIVQQNVVEIFGAVGERVDVCVLLGIAPDQVGDGGELGAPPPNRRAGAPRRPTRM